MTSIASTISTTSTLPKTLNPAQISSITPPKPIQPIAPLATMTPVGIPKATITTLPMPKAISTPAIGPVTSTLPSTTAIPSVSVPKPMTSVTPTSILPTSTTTTAATPASAPASNPAPTNSPAATTTASTTTAAARPTAGTIPGLEGIEFSSIPHRDIRPMSECYRIKKVEMDNYISIEKERHDKCQTQLLYVQTCIKLLLNNFKQNTDLNKKLLNFFQKVMAKNRKIFDENNSIMKIVDINSNPDLLTDDLFKKLTSFEKSGQEKVDVFMRAIQSDIYPLLDPLIKSYSEEFSAFEDKVSLYANSLAQSSRICGQFFDQLSTTYTSIRKFEAGESNDMGDLLPDLIAYYGHLATCMKLYGEHEANINQFIASFMGTEKNRFETVNTIFQKYRQLTTDFGQPIPADVLELPKIDALEKKIHIQIDEFVQKLGEKAPLLKQQICDNLSNMLDSNLIVKYGTVALYKGSEEWMNTTGILSIDDNLFLYVLDKNDLIGSFKNDKDKLHKTIRIKLSEISRTEGYPHTLTLSETITTLRFFKTNNKYFINVGTDADLSDWSKCFHDLQTNHDADEGPINL